jgi:hypothetical protein
MSLQTSGDNRLSLCVTRNFHAIPKFLPKTPCIVARYAVSLGHEESDHKGEANEQAGTNRQGSERRSAS